MPVGGCELPLLGPQAQMSGRARQLTNSPLAYAISAQASGCSPISQNTRSYALLVRAVAEIVGLISGRKPDNTRCQELLLLEIQISLEYCDRSGESLIQHHLGCCGQMNSL